MTSVDTEVVSFRPGSAKVVVGSIEPDKLSLDHRPLFRFDTKRWLRVSGSAEQLAIGDPAFARKSAAVNVSAVGKWWQIELTVVEGPMPSPEGILPIRPRHGDHFQDESDTS
jgi:hypothetical protein